MFRMDVIKRIKNSGYVLLGADVEEVKRELPFLDLKRSLTDMDYMSFVKESLLTQDEAYGRFKYIYSESKVFALVDGHIWIKAKILEEPDVIEAYRNLSGVEKNCKFSEILDQIDESGN